LNNLISPYNTFSLAKNLAVASSNIFYAFSIAAFKCASYTLHLSNYFYFLANLSLNTAISLANYSFLLSNPLFSS